MFNFLPVPMLIIHMQARSGVLASSWRPLSPRRGRPKRVRGRRTPCPRCPQRSRASSGLVAMAPLFLPLTEILIYISLLTIGPFQYSAWASSPVRLSWFLSSVAGEAGMHMAHRNIKEHVQHLVILSVSLLVRGRLLRS